MKNLFTKLQAQEIIHDYQYLVGTEYYTAPYPTLKVGFLRAEVVSAESYEIKIGVSAKQLAIPEFMGFTDHSSPLFFFP